MPFVRPVRILDLAEVSPALVSTELLQVEPLLLEYASRYEAGALPEPVGANQVTVSWVLLEVISSNRGTPGATAVTVKVTES